MQTGWQEYKCFVIYMHREQILTITIITKVGYTITLSYTLKLLVGGCRNFININPVRFICFCLFPIDLYLKFVRAIN